MAQQNSHGVISEMSAALQGEPIGAACMIMISHWSLVIGSAHTLPYDMAHQNLPFASSVLVSPIFLSLLLCIKSSLPRRQAVKAHGTQMHAQCMCMCIDQAVHGCKLASGF